MTLPSRIVFFVLIVPMLMTYLIARDNDYGKVRYRIRSYNLTIFSQFTVGFLIFATSFLILNPVSLFAKIAGFGAATLAGIFMTLSSANIPSLVVGLITAILGGFYLLQSFP